VAQPLQGPLIGWRQ